MTIYTKYDSSCEHSLLHTRLHKKIGDHLSTSSVPLYIYVGYVGETGIDHLIKAVELNSNLKDSRLFIGMALEGFTPGQLHLLHQLVDAGWQVRCSRSLNHSKVYLDGNISWGVIGSSNLNSVFSTDQLELDISVSEMDLPKIGDLTNSWWERAVPFLDWINSSSLKIIESLGSRDMPRVEKVPVGGYTLTDKTFELEIKMENRSNFNAFNSKPKNKLEGKGKPRDWYEIEINVPVSLGGLEGFPPVGTEFTVITDDGFMFKCKRNGTAGKNFQSTPALGILGRWLKGKLMKRNLIRYGELGTEDMLKQFGTNKLVIKQMTKDNHWLISFGVFE